MIKHICDYCKGDFSDVESNHYRVRSTLKLKVVDADGVMLEVSKACIGVYFFNLPLINVDGRAIAAAPKDEKAQRHTVIKKHNKVDMLMP